MATTYKSGDIVGKWETGHYEGGGIIPVFHHWVAETYTWRIRYISEFKIWVLTVSSSLPSVWNNHEIIQSATNLNGWREHLDPEFLASSAVKLLADDVALSKLGLRNEEELSDSYTQDNTTVAPNVTTQITDKDTDPKPKPFNTTYLLILGALVLAILVVKRFKK